MSPKVDKSLTSFTCYKDMSLDNTKKCSHVVLSNLLFSNWYCSIDTVDVGCIYQGCFYKNLSILNKYPNIVEQTGQVCYGNKI